MSQESEQNTVSIACLSLLHDVWGLNWELQNRWWRIGIIWKHPQLAPTCPLHVISASSKHGSLRVVKLPTQKLRALMSVLWKIRQNLHCLSQLNLASHIASCLPTSLGSTHKPTQIQREKPRPPTSWKKSSKVALSMIRWDRRCCMAIFEKCILPQICSLWIVKYICYIVGYLQYTDVNRTINTTSTSQTEVYYM